MRKTVGGCFLILAIIISGCKYKNIDGSNAAKVERTIKKQLPALANCIAVFSVVFSNYKDNWVFTDDIYLIEGISKVHYGYEIDKIKISIDRDKKMLYVTLPQIKEVARDWNVENIYATHTNYKPLDENGNFIDINKAINEEIDIKSEYYLEKASDLSKSYFTHYFEILAQELGLELKIIQEELQPPQIPPPEQKPIR